MDWRGHGMNMHLDIIIPTFNRCALLERTLHSLARATPPAQMTWRVTVADNRCTDGTKALVEAFVARDPVHFQYCFAPIQGKSAALNTVIAQTDGSLLGFLDDDEEVHVPWLTVVEREFQVAAIDFIGGPYRPVFEVPPPVWIDTGFPAVIGRVDGPPERMPFGPAFPGILMGGNAVIRRDAFLRTGGFRADLGPSGAKRLMSCEDRALYTALLRTGAQGVWVPDLAIDHHVPTHRMTRSYHWRWAFDHALSFARLERLEQGTDFRVPRWRLGAVVRNAWPALFSRDVTRRLRAQLLVLDALGFLYGAWGHRPLAE